MFLCPECHEKSGCEVQHIVISLGKCERCGKVAGCVDCKAYKWEAPTSITSRATQLLQATAKTVCSVCLEGSDMSECPLSEPCKLKRGLEAVERGYNAKVDKKAKLPPIKTLPTFSVEPTKEITIKVPDWWDDVSLINYLGHINQQNMVEAGFKYKVIEEGSKYEITES